MKAGQKFALTNQMSYIKILAIADGYVMARFKGCFPFCKSIKEFKNLIKDRCDIDL